MRRHTSSRLIAGLAAALTVSTLAAAPADASKAPRPRCHIVTGTPGDVPLVPRTKPGVGPNQDELDVTSADVATNRRYLTTVVRVVNLGSVLAAGPESREYLVFFHLGKIDYATSATHSVDGDTFWLNGGASGEGSSQVVNLGNGGYSVVSGVFDTAHNEIRVNVPRFIFSKDGAVKTGSLISNISAATFEGFGIKTAADTSSNAQVDQTNSPPGWYVVDSPSCVKPGQ